MGVDAAVIGRLIGRVGAAGLLGRTSGATATRPAAIAGGRALPGAEGGRGRRGEMIGNAQGDGMPGPRKGIQAGVGESQRRRR